MNISLSFIRLFFTTLCLIFSLNFAVHYFEGGWNLINSAVGLLGGVILSTLLMGSDFLLKRFNLRSFNMVTLGLFFGYLMGEGILFMLQAIINQEASMPLRFFVYLICTYVSLVLTARSAEEMHLSIPFVEFKQTSYKKKDILADLSILTDPRIIDLASSGLLDYRLIIPRFALKELYLQAESSDEGLKFKAKRCLEVVKKLESLPSLDLRYVETDFPEIKDPMMKLTRLARFMDTHLITSDMNRIQQSSIEGVRIINIHMLSNALKPITQAGESIHIEIQRYGKEAGQGVGYLDDGTMVVVNGGAEFFRQTIKAYVLSVKHTPSGRMIFCNAAKEGNLLTDQIYSTAELDADEKSLMTLES